MYVHAPGENVAKPSLFSKTYMCLTSKKHLTEARQRRIKMDGFDGRPPDPDVHVQPRELPTESDRDQEKRWNTSGPRHVSQEQGTHLYVNQAAQNQQPHHSNQNTSFLPVQTPFPSSLFLVSNTTTIINIPQP